MSVCLASGETIEAAVEARNLDRIGTGREMGKGLKKKRKRKRKKAGMLRGEREKEEGPSRTGPVYLVRHTLSDL